MVWADAMDATDWALSYAEPYRADVINLSYSLPATADDDGFAQYWDAVVDEWNVFVALSAGNRNRNGSPTIGTPSLAYNAVTVANVNDWNTQSIDDDTIASDSGRGPTPGGRKKPDLSAPGAAISSLDNSWAIGDDFIEMGGTSMAAPHVAGAAILMLSRNFLDPMSMKALLINSARDMGPASWDPAYGWGHVDLVHLWINFDNRHVYVVAPDNPGSALREDFQLYAGIGYTGENATLVWHRRAAYNGSEYPTLSYPLTDLDLFLYARDINTPPVISSESRIDNVEQVRWWSAGSGLQSVLKVKLISPSIAGRSTERYILATEAGFERRDGPFSQITPQWIAGNPWGQMGTIIILGAVIVNTGDLPAFDVQLDLGDTDDLSLEKGEEHIDIGTLFPGESSPMFYWDFEKLNDDYPQLSVTAQSSAYGEYFGTTEEFFPKSYLPLVVK